MRLIDADLLIKDLLEQIPLAENVPIFKEIIESQPTAYDVDKVVEQLEKYSLSIKEQIYKEQNKYGKKSVDRVLDHRRHEYRKGNIVNLDTYLCHCQDTLNGTIDGTELDLKENDR